MIADRFLASSPGTAYPFDPTWGWTRTQPLLSPSETWEGARVWEPTVLLDNANSQFRMYYDGGSAPASSTSAMGYATCPLASDPTNPANWTKNAGNPILGQGGSSYASAVANSNVYYDGSSTYYCFFADGSSTSDLHVATSTDGLTWGTPATAITAAQVAWVKGWANSFVWNDGSWKMIVEGASASGSPLWTLSYATSTDGLSWTVQGSGPLSSLQVGAGAYSGPWVLRGGSSISGKLRLFYHDAPTTDANFTNVYSAYSTDGGSTWTPETTPHVAYDGTTYATTQTADPSVIEHGGKTYLFYSGVNQSTSAYINVAVYNGTLESLLASRP